jgi:outer membrane lipoprotein LolB
LRLKHSIFDIFVLAVTGCATISPPPAQPPVTVTLNQKHLATLANIHAFTLKGKMGVVTNPNGFTGGISWQHQISSDNIDIFSPVGGKVANIAKTPSGVILTSQDGHTISAKDAETLTETTLGFRLPLSGLNDWALGRPSTSKIEASSWDDTGRLTNLKQDGWDISFENYAENNGVFVPNKIVLKSVKVNLKFLIENWQLF